MVVNQQTNKGTEPMTEIVIRLEFEKKIVTLPDVLDYIAELAEDGTLDFEIVKNKETDR